MPTVAVEYAREVERKLKECVGSGPVVDCNSTWCAVRDAVKDVAAAVVGFLGHRTNPQTCD
jgi:hypothetical protein